MKRKFHAICAKVSPWKGRTGFVGSWSLSHAAKQYRQRPLSRNKSFFIGEIIFEECISRFANLQKDRDARLWNVLILSPSQTQIFEVSEKSFAAIARASKIVRWTLCFSVLIVDVPGRKWSPVVQLVTNVRRVPINSSDPILFAVNSISKRIHTQR